MRRIVTVIALLFIVCFLFVSCSGLGGDSDFTIRISGTSGLSYSGNYMAVKSDGSSASRSVEGIIPAQYTVRGNIVSAVFQKQTENGLLKVEILRDGNLIKSSETTASYGVVSVATQ